MKIYFYIEIFLIFKYLRNYKLKKAILENTYKIVHYVRETRNESSNSFQYC